MVERKVKPIKALRRIVIGGYDLERRRQIASFYGADKCYNGMNIDGRHYIVDCRAPKRIFRLVKYDKKTARAVCVEVSDRKIIDKVKREEDIECADLRAGVPLRETPDLV